MSILVYFFTYYERLKLHKSGAPEPRKVRRKSLAYDLALEWFRNFARNADHLPNSSSRPLPTCLSKRAVYTMYKEEISGKPVLSRSHFSTRCGRLISRKSTYQRYESETANVVQVLLYGVS